jgi:hypothetical protein
MADQSRDKQGTEAMKHTALAAGLAALLGTSSLGCKTAPKLAFWKSDKSAESTALASSAPQLPSDLAKNEPAASAAQVAGGTAAPFVPGQAARTASVAASSAAPPKYPSTEAPAFSAGATNQLARTSGIGSGPQAKSANLGSIAMPYNPSATPTPKAATSSAALMAGADRYSSGLAGASTTATLPNYGQAPSGAALADAAKTAATSDTNSVANSYAPVAQVGMTPVAPYIPPRYGTTPVTTAAATAPTATTPAATVAATTPAMTPSAVLTASAQPYRPGGTSTYPGATPAVASTPAPVQVATRPGVNATPTTNTATSSSVPNAVAPATSSTTQPTTTRYW